MPKFNKIVGTKKDALELTGFSESYFDKLNAAGIIPGVSKPTGRKCFYNLQILQEWLLSKPVKTVEELKTEAATYVATNPNKAL